MELAVPVESVGFSDFLGCCQLSRTDTEGLRQGAHGARRRGGAASLEAGDGGREHFPAAGQPRLRQKLAPTDASGGLWESHHPTPANSSKLCCWDTRAFK